MSFFGWFVPNVPTPESHEESAWVHAAQPPKVRIPRMAGPERPMRQPAPANGNEVRADSLNPADLAALVTQRDGEAMPPRGKPQRRAA